MGNLCNLTLSSSDALAIAPNPLAILNATRATTTHTQPSVIELE